MKHSLRLAPVDRPSFWLAALLLALGLAAVPALALAQDLTNAGAVITVQPGTTIYVGTGGWPTRAAPSPTRAACAWMPSPTAVPST